MRQRVRFNKVRRRILFNPALYFCFFVGLHRHANAQTFTYALSISSGTYTALSGANTMNEFFVGDDDVISNAHPIGFTFFYGISCVGYTQFKVSDNGWLTFNMAAATADATNDLANNTTMRPGLAPLWDDLNLNWAVPQYLTAGTTPNQTLTVQWTQMPWHSGSGATGTGSAVISFQIKLHESSSVIDFIYHNEANPPVNGSASIGLAAVATGSGNYYSMNSALTSASKTVNTQTISVRPGEGVIYTWTPDCLTMPIELLRFDGKNSGHQNMLAWSTETETDNAFFGIERSSDGVFFTELGRVNGAGNSLVRKDYAYTDEETQPGVTYYRLKQTDFNGQYAYSRIVAVLNRHDVQMGHIFPNPADDQANFNFYSPTAGTLHASLVDNCGAEIYQTDLAIAKGDNALNLKADIPPGTYLLKASFEALDFYTTRKVIVK